MTDTAIVAPPAQTRGPLEFRTAQTLEVRWPDRIIEVCAMPYDREAFAEVRGRVIREVCAPGAYDGVERRANRVKANRDHNPERHVGRAVALHPSRSEGLVAELRMARTALGDETLVLAEDGDLEPSVEFAVMPGGEQWNADRTARRLTKCFLSAISLVPEGAYGEVGGQVLAVRSAGASTPLPPPLATPNLDAVRLQMFAEQHGVSVGR